MRDTVIGPGSLHRAITEVQQAFLNIPQFDHSHGRGISKHARG